MSSKQLVEDAINDNTIVVFSKSWCPHCKKAKTLINSLTLKQDQSVKIFELDEMDNGSDIQAYLQQKTSQRTVPNIFIKQEHVGGNDDLQAANKSGKLIKLLA